MVINNIEFDHADIYRDLDAILWQFHQLMRTIPQNGRIIARAQDANIQAMIEMGCWSPLETFGLDGSGDWTGEFRDAAERRIAVARNDNPKSESAWQLGGRHNLENAIAAIAASASAGVSVAQAVDALARFEGVKRRMERTATVADVSIYDDFAHHPTAIRRSIEGLKKRYPRKRIIVALEPRSNTMKLGVHNDTLADSLQQADLVCIYRPADFSEAFDKSLSDMDDRLRLFDDYDALIGALSEQLRAGDQVVFMSNGGFGAARQKLTMALQSRR